MKIDSIFKRIHDTLHNAAGVKFSFGNPMSVGDISIIPVARVSFGFGGGGGGGKLPNFKKKKQSEILDEKTEAENAEPTEFGGGGGGGVKTEPVGIYAIKDGRIKFYPIVTIRELAGIFSFVVFLLFRIGKLRRKKK